MDQKKITAIKRNNITNQQESAWTINLDNDDEINAKLLIGADGANSFIREQVGIELKTWDYEHTAVVSTVYTEYSHQRTAWQQFLATGPLAFLPLEDEHACSIVWSTSPGHANELLMLNENEFCSQLGKAFNNRLGDIKRTEARYSFPLHMRHAKNYVQSNVALLGDAAHTVHPLAGQGVNLGLLDAVCLAEVIHHAIKKNRNYAGLATLRNYERWRKGDNVAMLAGVEILKKIFGSDRHSIQQLTSWGLTITNHSRLLKSFFVNYALGYRGDLPRLAKL